MVVYRNRFIDESDWLCQLFHVQFSNVLLYKYSFFFVQTNVLLYDTLRWERIQAYTLVTFLEKSIFKYLNELFMIDPTYQSQIIVKNIFTLHILRYFTLNIFNSNIFTKS